MDRSYRSDYIIKVFVYSFFICLNLFVCSIGVVLLRIKYFNVLRRDLLVQSAWSFPLGDRRLSSIHVRLHLGEGRFDELLGSPESVIGLEPAATFYHQSKFS